MRLLSAFVIFLLCALSTRGFGVDLTLQEAKLDLLGADLEGAAAMYASWLDANASSAEAPVIFNRYFSLEQNLPSLLEAGKKLLGAAQKGPFVSETMARIAWLFEVAGKPEDARDAYLSAFAHGELSALESAFLVSLEMNDMNALQSALAEMKDAAGESRELLGACLAFQQGDIGTAAAAFIRISSSTSNQSVALKALWMSYEAALRSGDSAGRQQAVKLLGERFPHSPEYAIVASEASATVQRASPGVTLLALPGSFLIEAPAGGPAVNPQPTQLAGPAQSAPDQKLPAASDATDGKASTLPASPAQVGSPSTLQRSLCVQAGSFQMKENADDLIAELTRKGFSPTLRTETRQGKSLYRVVAGSGLSVEDARVLLDRLHQAGFSGYLLSDQQSSAKEPIPSSGNDAARVQTTIAP
jgi:cell division septation protein DedD